MPVERRTRPQLTERLARSAQQTALARRVRRALDECRRRTVPLHWSNLFAVVSLASLVALFATGLLLMFLYSPSSASSSYTGDYQPLHGASMSRALASTLHISFDVGGGMLLRGAHHWAALLLPASIMMQLLVSFFTGAFRRPRRGSWLLLFALLVVTLIAGWSGYALPDDLLSGTGLRIAEGVALGVPVVGTWLAWLLFGDQFPGHIIEHLYPIHVAITPVLLVALVVAGIRTAWRQKPPQFRGPGRDERDIVGIPLFPGAATRALGLFSITIALIVLIAATVTVNPIWLYGPSSAGDASAGSQPDWYTGFLDGALRLVPPGWEVVLLGHTWSFAIIVPVAVASLFLGLVAVYPFIEEWLTGDRQEHHLLDRPRDVPARTGIGVAGIVFYGTLWAAGSADVMARQLSLSLEGVITTLQITLVVGPACAFWVTRVVCIGLRARDSELLLHGYETGRIVRLPGGRYIEIHAPIDDGERWRLANTAEFTPLTLRPDERGRITLARRVRVRLSRFFLEDRMGDSIRVLESGPRSDADGGATKTHSATDSHSVTDAALAGFPKPSQHHEPSGLH